MNEQIIDLTHRFLKSYREKDFKTLWGYIHPEEQERIGNFVCENYSKEDLEPFLFEELDRRLVNLPNKTGVASRIRMNQYGNEFVLIVDDKYSGNVYTKPTQIPAINLPIKKHGNDYKIKVYED
ncbi:MULTISPECIES: hypothetical protein [unclassified Mammaliicoccus]|uniref:hypothetical protein n=1 Tax=unclassified Mammaliicoccus TaxID=2803851 RepID=UPI001EFAD6A2|nr:MULTISPECIES: hypothetical protein [unclassified Mammaliicoccus]